MSIEESLDDIERKLTRIAKALEKIAGIEEKELPTFSNMFKDFFNTSGDTVTFKRPVRFAPTPPEEESPPPAPPAPPAPPVSEDINKVMEAEAARLGGPEKIHDIMKELGLNSLNNVSIEDRLELIARVAKL